ncbi:hypothetical protein [uncultured Anoxybacillus sp.]|uniref:hypothetical protein n=1 Tax=uncultured Anoxybacillus sp. TaxID=263860 RepID=UPI00260746DD|nr:hypothetical protein [uncultured Anoxybacillus sp.]
MCRYLNHTVNNKSDKIFYPEQHKINKKSGDVFKTFDNTNIRREVSLMNISLKNTVILFIILLPILILSPRSINAENDIANDSELKRNIEYRKKMGLNHDPVYVSNLITSKKVTQSYEKHGVWLTEDELEEIENRIKYQEEKIPLILEYIRNNISSSDFGGLYVDQSKKGVVTISFSKNLKQMNKEINDIRKIFNNDSKIKFKQVQRSEKQLDEIHSTVLSKKRELKEQGINVTTIYSDIQRNKVIIGIYPFDSTARDSLVNIFGSDIEVIESDGGYEESRTAYTRPLEGGLRISNIDTGWGCTGGFSASYGNWVYYVTAGHCGRSSDRFSQGGSYFGYAYRLVNSGELDAMLISLGQLSYASNYNYGQPNFTSWQRESYEYVGQYVCMNGSYTGNACGVVKSTNYSAREHNNMTAADYNSTNGDSGSPTYYGSQIRGVHEGVGSNGWKIYTHVQSIVDYWGLSPRTW